VVSNKYFFIYYPAHTLDLKGVSCFGKYGLFESALNYVFFLKLLIFWITFI
jgi:hypothetical protein